MLIMTVTEKLLQRITGSAKFLFMVLICFSAQESCHASSVFPKNEAVFQAARKALDKRFSIESSPLCQEIANRERIAESEKAIDESGDILQIRTPGFAENLTAFSSSSTCYRNLYLASLLLGQGAFDSEDVWGQFEQTMSWLEKSDLKGAFTGLRVQGVVVDGKEVDMDCLVLADYLLNVWDKELARHENSRLFLDLKKVAGEEQAKLELRQLLFANLAFDRNGYLEELNRHIRQESGCNLALKEDKEINAKRR